MASRKASLAFNSNYQQVFQYPLQYIPIDPINVCAVILDSLSLTPVRARARTHTLSLSASRSLSSLFLHLLVTLFPLAHLYPRHSRFSVHARAHILTAAKQTQMFAGRCAFVSTETAHSFTCFVISCKRFCGAVRRDSSFKVHIRHLQCCSDDAINKAVNSMARINLMLTFECLTFFFPRVR